MKRTEMGRTGVRVPVIGQGTWMMGVDKDRVNAEVDALRTGIEAGMTLIDTAEAYAEGGAERVVGEAIKDCREDIFLVTKVWPTNGTYDGVLRSAEASLERLGTDYIDLYLLHWPSATHPVSETMRGMRKLVETGRIRFVGVSNFTTAMMAEAQDALGEPPLSCNQVVYHLKNRVIEKEVLPYCRTHRIGVMAYSPFGQGDFPEPGTEGRRVLDEIAETYDKTAYQVALNWIVSHEGVVAIPKAASTKHVKENAAAADFELTAEETQRIEAAFPLPPGEFTTKRM